MTDKTKPAVGAGAITPSDSTTFSPTYRALYVGVSGDIYVDCPHTGTNVKLGAVPVGILPIEVTRVYATGTTASDIVGLL